MQKLEDYFKGKLLHNFCIAMASMQFPRGAYAEVYAEVMQKLCRSYAEVMRKLCGSLCLIPQAPPKPTRPAQTHVSHSEHQTTRHATPGPLQHISVTSLYRIYTLHEHCSVFFPTCDLFADVI